MNVYVFLFFSSFTIYLYFTLYSFYLNKRSPLNILFSLYTFSLVFWSFGNLFLYSSTSVDSAWFWYKLSGIGWCYMHAFGLHFALVLAKKDKIFKKKIYWLILYIPSTFFYFKVLFSKLFVDEIVISNGDVKGIFVSPNIYLLFYLIYHVTYLALFIYFIWKWGKESTKKSEKKQSKILFFIALIPGIFGTITDALLPLLNIYILKPIAILILLVWILAIWYVIIKYKFLKIKSFYPVFNEILTRITDIIFIIDRNGNILKSNNRFIEMVDMSEDNILENHINDYLLLEDKNWFNKITKEEPLNICAQLILNDGVQIPITIFASLLIDEEKDEAGILVVGQDMSITFQLQDEIRKREEAKKILKQSEERYRSLINKIPEVILIHKNDMVVYINNTSDLFNGYEVDEIIGTSVLNYIYDEYKPIVMQNLKRRLAGEDVLDHEIVLVDKFENKKTVIFRSSTTFYDNQPMFLTLLIDITERKKIEESVKKAKEAAEIANTTKSEFLATMSHEIRTPINGILGMLNLISGTSLTDEQDKYLTLAKSSCEYLTNVVNSILDYSKIEAGKFELEYINFDIFKLLNITVDEFRLKAKEKNLGLTFLIEESVEKFIYGDPNKIKQIVVNLISNAIKFSDRGRVILEVRKNRDFDTKTELRFTVTDTGVGIPREKTGKLFKIFSQVDSSSKRKHGGTGLGLVISKKLIEMMNGDIWFETEENVGTKFYFTLILDKAIRDDFFNEKIVSIDTIRNDNTNYNKNLKILIAEDNEINQEFLSVFLKKNGYLVDCVSNGREVIEILTKKSYDLILMDIEMPEMDGLEATIKIREIEKNNKNVKKIPIIALTAYAMKGDRDKCINAGMNEYVSKPIKIDLLLSKIEKYIKEE